MQLSRNTLQLISSEIHNRWTCVFLVLWGFCKNIKHDFMGWACGACGWGGGGLCRVLVGKPEGKRPLGRPRRRWMDNIRMDLQEVGCGCMDWIGLAQDRDRWRTLVSAVMNLRVPWNAGNFLTSCKSVSFSRGTLHHGVSIKHDFTNGRLWERPYRWRSDLKLD